MAENETQETESGGLKRLAVVGLAVVVGVLAGAGGGVVAAKTLLAGQASAPVAAAGEDHEAASDEHAEESGESHGEATGEHGAGGEVHVVDNLVLNPADSRGTRFLMVSVAFAVKDEAVSSQMEARDPELRDALLDLLGSKTVSELANIERRDSLKVELAEGVAGMFPRGAIRHVYFPQFVIQ